MVACRGCLLLGKAHQLLADGFDERGGGMAGGNGLLGRSRRRETQAHCVQVGRGGGRLSHSAPGGLEHRHEGVVERVENLDNGCNKRARKRKEGKTSAGEQLYRERESKGSRKKRRK